MIFTPRMFLTSCSVSCSPGCSVPRFLLTDYFESFFQVLYGNTPLGDHYMALIPRKEGCSPTNQNLTILS